MNICTLVERGFKARVLQSWPKDLPINGPLRSHPQVHDNRFYGAVVLRGTLGLGEAYMKGWWTCEALDQFFEDMLRRGFLEQFRYHPTMLLLRAREFFFNEQKRGQADKIAHDHYDPGNKIILSFIDEVFFQYTCGYWENCCRLDDAQERKLELICRKLELKEGDTVLDIGGGYGGLAKYMAEVYGCHVTIANISLEQVEFAREYCQGLPVDVLQCDYRDISDSFDKVVSVGMFEHVGHKNYREFMEAVRWALLKPGGLFLLHTIGKGSDSIPLGEPWIIKHIFPGGMLPTLKRVTQAAEGLFDLVDLHEFGEYYDQTLMVWLESFRTNWAQSGVGRSMSEYRMWEYYLACCAALFRTRKLNLWQFVFREQGGPGYVSVR